MAKNQVGAGGRDELVRRLRADKRLIGRGRDCAPDPAAGGGSASRAFSGLAKKRRNERLEVCSADCRPVK